MYNVCGLGRGAAKFYKKKNAQAHFHYPQSFERKQLITFSSITELFRGSKPKEI